MTFARLIPPLLFVLGLTAGSLVDSPLVQEPRRAGDYWMLAADFHVHAFPGDGSLSPWALRREAGRRGLDVFALTNHNQTFTARLAQRLSRMSGGPIVLPGEEITGRDFHLIAVGIERTVDWDQSAADAIADVHAQGGVAIAAHPVRPFWKGFDDRALALLDGVEAAHPGMHVDPAFGTEIQAFYRRALERNPGVAAIGSSDFHATPSPGLCRTYVIASEPTERGVIDAVRQGRTVAADRDGNLYGDPGLVRLVDAARDTATHPGNADVARLLALGCTWVGLLGLVIFGIFRIP